MELRARDPKSRRLELEKYVKKSGQPIVEEDSRIGQKGRGSSALNVYVYA